MARTRASWLIRLAIISAAVCLTLWLVYEGALLSRASSEQATCTRNLRLLGQAAEMYQNDFKCLVPYGAPFAWPPAGKMWPELLEPYLREIIDPGDKPMVVALGSTYRCPTAFRKGPVCWCGDRSYGINYYCGGWMPKDKPVVIPVSKVRYSSRTVRLAETSWPASQSGTLFAPTPNKPLEYIEPPGWHGGRNNVLWIDGHVSSMTNEEYLRTDDGPSNGNVWCRLKGPKPPVR